MFIEENENYREIEDGGKGSKIRGWLVTLRDHLRERKLEKGEIIGKYMENYIKTRTMENEIVCEFSKV